MSFDLSANFSYTGTTQYWDKPQNIKSVYFVVKGGGGGGSALANGGGGAYVFSNFNYFNGDVSYNNVMINVGSGGKAPPIPTGGISIGGSTTISNGGSGRTYSGFTSGGGGGMSSVFFLDACGNEIIKIVAGGGGGAGENNGGDGSKIGIRGSGAGGGQGGNTDGISGFAGLGGVNGGVNGYNFVDSSNNGNYRFIGGGGGSGGSYAGGGGGSGFGGGAGGYKGGGGGGGSYASFLSRTAFIPGGGGKGGGKGQDASGGTIQIFWNSQIPPSPPAVIEMFMLNSQHNCQSQYKAPTILPSSVLSYQTNSTNFSNAGVIGSDNELYFIADDGTLYAFDHTFTYLWTFTAGSYNCTFRGTPAITGDGTLYIAAASTTQNYFFAVVDTGGNAGGGGPVIKWRNPPPINGRVAVSPILDLSGVIYTATDVGTIYAFDDYDNIGHQLWQYSTPNLSARPITNSLVFDICYNKMAYTTTNSPNFNLYAIDISRNKMALPTPRWGPIVLSGDSCSAPSIDDKGIIYLSTSNSTQGTGLVYAYDISSGQARWPNPVQINDVKLSAVAIDNANQKIYCTSQNALNMIDISNGYLEWSYQISDTVLPNSANSIPVIDASSNIYFGGGTNYVQSVNTLDRILNWKYQTGNGGAVAGMPLLSDNNNIYFGANDGKIYDLSGNGIKPAILPIVQMYMLNPQHTGISPYYGPATRPTLRLTANFNASNFFVLPSVSIAKDGTLYIGTNNGYLTALNPSDFSIKWSTPLTDSTTTLNLVSPKSMYTTPAIGFNGTIYIGSNEGKLYAVNPLNGALKWVYRTGANFPLQSSPMIDNDGTLYFGAGQRVYSVGDDGYYGFLRWLVPFAANANVNSSPALGQNGFLYFGSDDGFVYAVNRLTGLLLWKFNATVVGSPVVQPIYTSVTVDASNNVIIGNGSSMDGVLYYLDGMSLGISDASRNLWTCKPQASLGGPMYNTVAVKGNTIYLSTIGHVYAINRLNGQVKWRLKSTNYYYTSPIIDASGTIFVASLNAITNNGTIHALKDNGSSVARFWPDYDTGNSYQRLAQPILGEDGTIYITSTVSNNNSTLNATNMHIYAIK